MLTRTLAVSAVAALSAASIALARELPRSADIGKAKTLTGLSGLKVQVTVLGVQDPGKPSTSFNAPRSGYRFVAVKLRLKNVGKVLYKDTPANGADLVSTTHHSFDASIFDQVKPGFGSLKISKGDFRVGYISFELPKREKAKTFQLALNSGFADQTGEWRLR